MKTPQHIEDMFNQIEVSLCDHEPSLRKGLIAGAIQMQKDLLNELKHLCTYNSTAIGKQAECYLKVMPTLLETLDKHDIGVFLRGIVYRTYTQAQQDIKEACSEGFDEWIAKQLKATRSESSGLTLMGLVEDFSEVWEEAKLSNKAQIDTLKQRELGYQSDLRQKDAEIDRLKKKISSFDAYASADEKYQEAVKDIEYLTFKIKGHLTLDSLEKLNDKIRTKYGLDKKEG